MVVFGQSCCIRSKVVVFGQNWVYSCKSGSIKAKVVVFGQKLFYSGKSGCIRAKIVVLGRCGSIGAKMDVLRWLPPVLHFPEPLNFTKGFLAHHDGLVPVLARWCYNSF